MKFLFVTREALSVDLAWQLTKEGHEVNFYVQNQSEKDVGDGFVTKVDQWEAQKDWADVIIFDDIGFGATADKLRAEGKFVVGGTPYTDKLEDDREFGQEELKKVGVNILPSWNFSSFDEAVAFMNQYPDRYVIKPSGKAQNEKELLFVGQEEDGKDVEQVLEHYKQKWSSKIKIFLLQKYAQGVEVAVGAFFNGTDYIEPININFEHKRLFPNDIGPSTGEMGTAMFWSKPNPIFEITLLKMREQLRASKYVGYIDINCIANSKGVFPLEFTCFDEDTEILTREGWTDFAGVKVGDEALSIDPLTRNLAWKRITNKLVKNYTGEMIRLGARDKSHSALDVLVTPEHNVLIDYGGVIKLVRADSIPIHETKIVRTGVFSGEAVKDFEIPEYVETHYLGRHRATMQIVHSAIHVEAHAFMRFLGLYIAEGCSGQYILSIAQSPSGGKRSDIETILNDFGVKYSVQKNGAYQFCSRQLCAFFESLGLGHIRAGAKFVPSRYKDLSPDLLDDLVHGYSLGDGNRNGKTGQLTFGTTSARLAGDLQEILVKCGMVGNIRIQHQKGTRSIGGYIRNSDMHIVSVREKKTDYSLDKRVISREHYSGIVWDVEVADWHTMLVRRHGKAFFSGNCRFGYPTV